MRAIARRKVKVELHTKTWQFFDGGAWRPYESLVQSQNEHAYRAYSDGIGASSLDVQFPGRPDTYHIDFVRGEQFNAQSQERRPVRRV